MNDVQAGKSKEILFWNFQVNVALRMSALFISALFLFFVDVLIFKINNWQIFSELICLAIGASIGMAKRKVVEKSINNDKTFLMTYLKSHDLLSNGFSEVAYLIKKNKWIPIFSPISFLFGVFFLIVFHISLPLVSIELVHLAMLLIYIRKVKKGEDLRAMKS